MRWGKFIVFVILFSGVVIGNALFKNILVKRGIESALQKSFGAKAEIKGVRFSPLKGRLSFVRLEQADRENPMRNLFELGKGVLHLDTWQLLKGKVVIRQFTAEEIQWNTSRQSSGALKKKGSRKVSQKKKKSKKTSQKASHQFDVNVQDLVNQEWKQMKTPLLLSNLNQSLTDLTNRWMGRAEKTRGEVKDFEKNIREIRSVDVNRIKNVQELIVLKKKIDDTLKGVETLKAETEKGVSDLQKDANFVKEMPRQIQKSLDMDLNYLKDKINLPEGGALSVVHSLVGAYLGPRFSRLSHYLFLAVRLGKHSPKSAKKEKKEDRRRGTIVYFPSKDYPRFWLENFKVSVKDPKSGVRIFAFLENFSSEPDLTGKPSKFSYTQTSPDLDLKVRGFLDLRTNAAILLDTRVLLDKIPFELNEGLSLVEAKSVKGTASSDFRFSVYPDSLKGRVKIKASKIQTELLPSKGMIGEIFAETLGESDAKIEVNYEMPTNGDPVLKADSNLDEILARKIGKKIREMVKKTEQELSLELRKRLEPALKKNKSLKSVSADLEKKVLWSEEKVQTYKKELDQKKKEAEARIQALKNQAKNKVEQEKNRLIKDAKKKIKVPSGLGF